MALDTLGKLALATINTNGNTDKKKVEPKVLDEETHVANIEKIIERDFFPDLPKVTAQLEYIDAVERKDVQKIWQLQQKYSMKRVAVNSPSTYGTPSTFETPESTILQTPGTKKKMTETISTEQTSNEKKDEGPTRNLEPEEARDQELSKLTLNGYMNKYTSEDDKAFSEIMTEVEKKHQMKHAWLYKSEQLQLEDNDDRKKIEMWNYVPRNAVMYVPEGLQLSASEKLEMSKLKKQEISHSNTRFVVQPFTQLQNDSNNNNAISNQILKLEGKVGPDGKELLPSKTPTVGGYKFLATPSPAPGVDASPLMTWGEIEGTPFRLDGMETPRLGNSGSGPNFKIPEVPKRDRLLHQLAEKASKVHRAKKMEALKQAAATFSSSSPRSFMTRTERLQSLSPAAQRLVSNKLRINSNSSLKASYTPSPCHTPTNNTNTPKLTPKNCDPSPKRKLSKSDIKSNDECLLTDNLLKLPTKKSKGI